MPPRIPGRDWSVLGLNSVGTATNFTGTLSGSVWDVTGFEGVAFWSVFDVTSTGNGVKVRGGTASGSLSDLAGTWQEAVTSQVMVSVFRPAMPFVQAQAIVGTAGGRFGPNIVSFGFGPRTSPVTNSSLVSVKTVYSPVTGTATSS